MSETEPLTPLAPLDEGAATAPAQFAALDLGSNSFHLITARVIDQQLQPLLRFKQRVHLATGLDEDNYLDDESMQRGLDALRLCAQRLEGFSPDKVHIVATHTLREAKNRDEFIARAAEFLPYPIETISGREEARLIYKGVAQTTPTDAQRLVIDIGGGSTELISGHAFTVDFLTSRLMGCVSFTERFFGDGEITAKRFDRACLAARKELEPVVQQLTHHTYDVVYATSGTAKAIAHWVRQQEGAEEGIITKAQLQKCREALIDIGRVNKISISGMDPEREVILTAGVAILWAIMDRLKIKQLFIHDAALREGVLYELASRVMDHQDVRQRTVDGMAARYQVDVNQSRRVEETALRFFKDAAEAFSLDEGWLNRLLWAARLHEIGLQINSSSLQQHSAYILANADMPGFGREEQALLATLVRSYRKKIKLDVIPDFSLYKTHDIYRLIALLRLAVLNNSDRQDSEPRFFVHAKDEDTLAVDLTVEGRMDPVLLDDLRSEVKQFAKLGLCLEIKDT